MIARSGGLRLTYSLADQSFRQTKSLGIFNVATGLFEALADHPGVDELCAVVNEDLRGRIAPRPGLRIRVDESATGSRLGRILYDQWRAYTHARESGLPWLLLPKGYASVVRSPPVRLACYVHDAMHEHYAECHPDFIPGLELGYFRRALRATLESASVILTNSDFTGGEVQRVARRAGLPAPRVATVGIGIPSAERPPEMTREGLLVLCSRFPHKRTDLAQDFLLRWQTERGFAEPVHWVGDDSVVARSAAPNWVWHGRLGESEYRRVVSRSRALVYFTEYEGFGMPPVEATLARVASVYSDIPACREAMMGLGFAFSNQSYDSFSRQMDEALMAPSTALEAWAERLSQTHDWDDVATRVVEALLEPRLA